ncbi:MAG TPA: 2-amino-4-hydroxy-6-hydroxymethyldihydropteridine diphosphokinase [Tepidiformaceae bacterium]|nr:2-amino-4-hydroxy-6-hydroxymethyldihydropteridine diphosphokinase [Tepidiformaceae bacterium]
MSAEAAATVFLALGSNLGDRLANLQAAINLLWERGVQIHAASSVWETAPVPADQPAYLNAVLRASTSLQPHDLLHVAKDIEHDLGRRPSRRWGPRPIDIDILFYSDLQLTTPDLTIPHSEILGRAFVLAPLAEVTPEPLPVFGEPALALLARADQSGLRRTCLPLQTAL